MPGHRARVQLVLLMVLAALFLPLNQLGLLQWQKEVERVQACPQCAQLVSQQQPQQQLCTQSTLDIPNAQSTPTQRQSASSGTSRFFVSSPAVAMPNELWAGEEASGVPDGVAGDGDEELERVFESIGEAEDSGRRDNVKREAQGVLQLAAKTKRRLAGRSKP